jgi:hypothetical protein
MDIIHILKWVVKTFEDTKGLIRILNRKKRHTIQWPQEQAMIYET